MACGLLKNGTDLDDIFAARTGTAITNTGFQVGGVDIAQRWERLSSGSAAAATGYTVNGSDLNTLFAAYGTLGSPISLVLPAIPYSSYGWYLYYNDTWTGVFNGLHKTGGTWNGRVTIGRPLMLFNADGDEWSDWGYDFNLRSGSSTGTIVASSTPQTGNVIWYPVANTTYYATDLNYFDFS